MAIEMITDRFFFAQFYIFYTEIVFLPDVWDIACPIYKLKYKLLLLEFFFPNILVNTYFTKVYLFWIYNVLVCITCVTLVHSWLFIFLLCPLNLEQACCLSTGKSQSQSYFHSND